MSLYNINIIVNKQVSNRSDINCVCTQHVCTLIQSHYSIFILYYYNVLQLETPWGTKIVTGGFQQLIEPMYVCDTVRVHCCVIELMSR